jgi:hypothetical protein
MSRTPTKPLTGSLRRGEVKKNVAAIHVSGKLTLLQRKLSNVLLLNAYDTLVHQTSHRIDARTLCTMIGYNSNDMETLKASLRGLVETLAEWDMLDGEGRQEWGVSSLLAYAKLKDGICEYAYSAALAEKLHDPKVFALINLNIQRKFTSGHALALYENCFRFVRTGSSGWWSLELFRRLMGVDSSAYYETFKHLNAKIIKPAVAEVNKTSNIILTPEFKRMGRSVTDIRFLIEENPQLAILDLDDGQGVRNTALYDRLRGQGVSDRLARQWIAEHGANELVEKLDYITTRDDVRDPAKYLQASLKQPRAVPPVVQSDRAKKLARVSAIVADRSPTQRDADKRLFLSRIDDPFARDDFERHGWMSPLNALAVFAFWEELDPGSINEDG